ncbi:MAG: hypothetical protein EON48_16740, partial [Acetobacteraceae bacterium]
MTDSKSSSSSENASKKSPTGELNPEAWVPCSQVADHILELHSLGMNATAIARRAGISVDRIGIITRGDQPKVRRRTADLIFAVKYTQTFADNERHVAWPTLRRIGALSRLGWNMAQIAAEADLNPSLLQQLMKDGRTHVHAPVALAVDVAYEKLRDREGPRPQSRFIARRQGWPPPQAYHDDEIDDFDELTTDRVRARW